MDSKVLAYAQKCAHPKWYLYLLHFLVATTVFAPCFALWVLFTIQIKRSAHTLRLRWSLHVSGAPPEVVHDARAFPVQTSNVSRN